MTACAVTSSSKTSSRRAARPGRSRPTPSPDRSPTVSRAKQGARLTCAVVWLAALLLGGCAETTTYYGAQADELHGRRILQLRPTLIAPTPAAVHDAVVARADRGLAGLQGIGAIVDRESWREQTGVALEAADAYDVYSNTLSLTGISDPELSRRLSELLQVDLLAIAQPIYVPCSTCEEGDQLWLVGELVDARTGKRVFRSRVRIGVSDGSPAALTALVGPLIEEYLGELQIAFRLRAHRERFKHLKQLGTP